ncbi:hypothetical protein KBTX_01007 [wastewater metagenome]|uniref:EAL domain-containing protein n=2 Tax=unclassified sequences TaxID=12908 RepID=A0A5B8R6Q0_9ZZZZ|nr:DUF1631 family protein [Arhodomonas sp. KWT]QEA04699.1 hypothetical protein KBTEX_01007 [uncultured organism]
MSRERRAYQRHPVQWPAEIVDQGQNRVAVTLQDVCVGGVFAAVDDSGAAASLTIDDHRHVCFYDPVAGETREIAARIARSTPAGVGLAFESPQPELVGTLQSVAGAGAPPRPESPAPRSGANARVRWVHEVCRRHAEWLCNETIPTFASDVVDELFNRSRTVATTQEQTSVFKTFQIVRRQRETLPTTFLRHVLDGVDHLSEGSGEIDEEPEHDPTPGELSLVDEQEFDDWLRRSELVGDAERRNRNALRALNRRLNYALDASLDDSTNPVSPEGLTRALSETLGLDRVPSIAVHTIYEVFGQKVFSALPRFYERINAEFREAGLLPDAEKERPEIRMLGGGRALSDDNARSAGKRGRSRITGHGVATGRATEVTEPHPTAAAGGGHDGERVTTAALTSVARELETLANDTGGAGPSDSAGDHGPAAAPADGDTGIAGPTPAATRPASVDQRQNLAAVDRWFRQIRADRATPDYVRDWADELAAAARQEQIDSGAFLAGGTSPVNRLIDAMERAGVAMNVLPERNALGLRQTVDALVRPALERGEATMVDDAARRVAEAAAEPLRERAQQIERIDSQLAGRDRLEQAREAVDAVLAERIDGHRVPQLLSQLMTDGWRNLLVLVRLRFGGEHDTWRRCVAVIDRLLAGLGHDDEAPGPIRDAERVVEYARFQLRQFSRLTPGLADTLDAIESAVLAVCRGESPEPAIDYTDAPPRPHGPPERPGLWQARARLLGIGDWLVPAREGEPLQLRWMDTHRRRFVFLARDGHTTRELGLDEVANTLRDGCRVVDDLDEAPFTERQWRETLVQAHDTLIRRATRDPLTEAYNRKTFARALEQLAHYGAGRRYAVVQIALRDLNAINERAGRVTGDRLLRRAAHLIRRAAGAHGIVARVSGDEFAAVIDVADTEAAELLTERLRRSVSALPGRIRGELADTPWRVAAVVTVFDTDNSIPDRLLERLGEACARARDNEASALVPAPSHESPVDQDYLCRLIDDAIQADSLSLRAQRIQPRDGERQREQRYELFPALYDRGGEQRLLPGEFLGVARQRGRMPQLDSTMIRHGMALARRLAARDGRDTVVHVNIAAASVDDDTVLDTLSRLSAGRERDGNARVCLEISEATAAGQLERVVRFLDRAHGLGVELCIDAFGTTLAGYDFMRLLPVDLLKLDPQVIERIDLDRADQAMTQTVTEMAHLLGRRIIAAGVERIDLFDRLREIDADYLQGYAIERPQPLR